MFFKHIFIKNGGFYNSVKSCKNFNIICINWATVKTSWTHFLVPPMDQCAPVGTHIFLTIFYSTVHYIMCRLLYMVELQLLLIHLFCICCQASPSLLITCIFIFKKSQRPWMWIFFFGKLPETFLLHKRTIVKNRIQN